MSKEKLIDHLHLVIDRLKKFSDNNHFDSSLIKKEALELYESALLLDFTEATASLQEAVVEAEQEEQVQEMESQHEEDNEVNTKAEMEQEEVEAQKQAELVEESVNEAVSTSEMEHKPFVTGNSILDKLQSKPISNLKSAIGINDRFSFINDLFSGNVEAYSRAIEELNHLENIESAQLLIRHDYVDKYQWDFESETVLNFLTLIERRYQ